jgi:hypothetical protein
MHGPDLLTPRQVSDRARQFKYSMIRPRRQVELAHAQHDVAARIKLCPSSGSLQNWRISPTHMSELQIMSVEPFFEKRCSWILSAACTLALVTGLESVSVKFACRICRSLLSASS